MANSEPHRAALLLSASDAFLKATDYQIPLAEARYLGALIDRVRASLEPDQFEPAWARGASLTLSEAINAARPAAQPPS